MTILLCQSEVDLVWVDSGRDNELSTNVSAIAEIDSVRLVSTHREYDLRLAILIHDACTTMPLREDGLTFIPNVLHLPVGMPPLEGFIRLRTDLVRYFTYREGYFESYIPSGLVVIGNAAEWFIAYHCAGDSPAEAFNKVLTYHPECLSGRESL